MNFQRNFPVLALALALQSVTWPVAEISSLKTKVHSPSHFAPSVQQMPVLALRSTIQFVVIILLCVLIAVVVIAIIVGRNMGI